MRMRVAAVLMLWAVRAHADDAPATTDAPGEVIIVTSARRPEPARDAVAATAVIDRAQLASAPQVLADDVVRSVPGVGTFRRSSSAIADPTSQGLNLRGVGPSGVSRALVLRDGVPLNDPFGGWVYWRALSTLAIERIEVVPSGASALFGDFALGGVLQVIGRPVTGRSLDVVASAGSFRTARLAARATEQVGDLGLELAGEAMRSDGYAPIAADQRGAVDGSAGSHHASASVRISYDAWRGGAQFFDEALDAGTAHTTADVRTWHGDLGWQRDDAHGALAVRGFAGWQRFRQERARVSAMRDTAATASQQRTPSNDQGAAATWSSRALGTHAIVVGIDGQRVAGTATDALSPAMVSANTLVRRAAGGAQWFAGAFASDTVSVSPALALVAALRLDTWRNTGASRTLTTGDGRATTTALDGASEAQLDPRLGAIVHASDAVALRGSIYRAFRAPTLNELYRPFQVGTVLTAANERLRPETLWGGELGGQIVDGALAAQATAFWNRMRDPISNVTLAAPVDGATRQRQNLGRSRVRGLELALAWQPAPAWQLRIAHAFSDARVVEAPAQPMLVGKRLAQDPRHRTTAAVRFDDARFATVAVELRYLDRMFEDDLNTLPIGAVVLIDARVERALAGGLSMFAALQNALDRRYLVGRAGIDTEGAPRSVELGLAFHR